MNSIIKFLLSLTCIIIFTSTAYTQANAKADSLPHATFYFYRAFVPAIMKSVKKIPIYINDSLVYNLKSNNYITLKVYKEGNYTVAVDKKGDTDTGVKVKFGKEYFFKCDGLGGFLNFKTTIDAVPTDVGKKETGALTTE